MPGFCLHHRLRLILFEGLLNILGAESVVATMFMQLFGGTFLGIALTHLLVAIRGDKSSEILLTRLNAMTGLFAVFVLYFLILPQSAITFTNPQAIKIQVRDKLI